MTKFKRISARDNRVTFEEFIRDIVAAVSREDDFEEFRTVSRTRRQMIIGSDDRTEVMGNAPDPRWPEREALLEELKDRFLQKVTSEGWEVESIASRRPPFLQSELEAARFDIYANLIVEGGRHHSALHLSRKQVDFEAVLIEQFEIEAENTPPGQLRVDQIFDNMLKRCNLPLGIRAETRSRIKKLARISQEHSKPGPRPSIPKK